MDYRAFIGTTLLVILLELAFGLSSLKNKLDKILATLSSMDNTLAEIRDTGIAQQENTTEDD